MIFRISLTFDYKNIDDTYSYPPNGNESDNEDLYYAKKVAPCKIWFGETDNVNNQDIAKRFINKMRNAGGIATFRTAPVSSHCVWNLTSYSEQDISVEEDGITCSPYAVEMWNWIKRFDY